MDAASGPAKLLSEAAVSLEARNFRVLDSYQEVVRTTLDGIGNATSEIHLASTYYEPIIGNKLVEKFAQGVHLNILDGNPSGTSFVERIREAARADPKKRDLLYSLLESPNVKIGKANIQYSFFVLDRFHCGVELMHPLNPSQFNLGFTVDSSKLAEKLIQQFETVISGALFH